MPAIRQLIAEGININVTLLFAQSAYEAVAEAFLAGLEERLGNGQSVAGIASVASFFVSRIDTQIDKEIDRRVKAADSQTEKLKALRGKNVKRSHGLDASMEQLEAETEEFRAAAAAFIDGLISHYVLDGGRLVVAHAGLIERNSQALAGTLCVGPQLGFAQSVCKRGLLAAARTDLPMGALGQKDEIGPEQC